MGVTGVARSGQRPTRFWGLSQRSRGRPAKAVSPREPDNSSIGRLTGQGDHRPPRAFRGHRSRGHRIAHPFESRDRCGPRTDGGDEGTRTPDPLLAKEVLSQLSYIPIAAVGIVAGLAEDDGAAAMDQDPTLD